MTERRPAETLEEILYEQRQLREDLRKVAEAFTQTHEVQVDVKDISIPLLGLVELIVKALIASVPAWFIVAGLFVILLVVLGSCGVIGLLGA